MEQGDEGIPALSGGGKTRRAALRIFGKVGITAVAGVAGMTTFAQKAQARGAKPMIYQYGCCGTAKPPFSCGGTDFYNCTFPCTHFKRCWHCSSGASCLACCECQSGSGTCEQGGTYYCSQVCDGGCSSPAPAPQHMLVG
jgi:hypothetical protein